MTATSPRPEKQRLRSRKLRTEPQGVWIFRGLGKGENQSREKTSGRVTSWKAEEGGVGGIQIHAGRSEGAPCTEHSGQEQPTVRGKARLQGAGKGCEERE